MICHLGLVAVLIFGKLLRCSWIRAISGALGLHTFLQKMLITKENRKVFDISDSDYLPNFISRRSLGRKEGLRIKTR